MSALSSAQNLLHDARLCVRSLRHSPGFTSAVVVLLALGIGANVAVLSVAELLFVRPPAGVAHPETTRRIYLRSNWSVGDVTVIESEFSYPAYVALRDAFRGRVQLAGFTKADTEIVGDGEHARVAHASADFFPVLGVVPSMGRVFTVGEDQPGSGRPVAVISDAFWKSHFGNDPHVIGRPLDIEFTRYTVIGVTRPGFTGPDLARSDIWIPMGTLPTAPGRTDQWYNNWRMGFMTQIVARVSDNTPGTEQWMASLGTLTYRRGEAAHVKRGADTTATLLIAPILESLGPSITPTAANAITVRLLGVTAILLLIAFANVGNLLVARALSRRNEIAIRIALGVSRFRLVTQLVTESLLLSLLAALVSLVPAIWGAVVLRRLLMPGVPLGGQLLDLRVFGAAIGLAVVGGLVVGALPALRVHNLDIVADIKGKRGQELPARLTLRNVLVAAQSALCVLLLIGAGLFIRSLHEVRSIDLGYTADRIVYGSVDFRDPQSRQIESSYSGAHRVMRGQGLETAAADLAHVPGVEHVALTSAEPMGGYAMMRLFLADGKPVPRMNNRDPVTIWVSATFLDVSGIKLMRGRFFTASEQAASAPVVVVNETAARAYWPDGDAVGKCLHLFVATEPCSVVVGVIRDPHLEKIIEQPTIQLYVPVIAASVIVARAAAGRSSAVAAAMTTELRRVFPTAEPPHVETLEGALEPELRPWRLGTTLFSVAGALALMIAAFGLYSVVSYSVSQRTRELGIRAALGAEPKRLVLQVVSEGLKAPIIGFAVGAILAVIMWPAIAALVYHASPSDPVTMTGVALLLVATAMLATIVPALRAARVDVVSALRSE